MGITPITNLTPLPLARSLQADLDPLPMERVENSARTGDETYSPSGGRSARGSEDDVSEDDLEEFEDQVADESSAHPREGSEPRKISFFA
jgi:hypothetical protein